jgi:hypothetical protein
MPAFYDGLNQAALSPVDSHSLLHLDQWVRTEHNGKPVVGRILAVLNRPGGALYEVELPLQTNRGAMTRVVRFPGEVVAVEGRGDDCKDSAPATCGFGRV